MIHRRGFLFVVLTLATVTYSKPQRQERQSYPYMGAEGYGSLSSRSINERNPQRNLVDGVNLHLASRVSPDDSGRQPMKNVTSKILFGGKPSRESPDIIFPGPTGKAPLMALSEIVEPPCGEEETFCEGVPNYPIEVIENIIKKYADEFMEFNGSDDVGVEQRIGGIGSGQTELCDSNRTDVVPQQAFTQQGWRYVVNTPNFSQIFQVEKCKRANLECKFNQNFPNNYRTVCVQKFIYRKILVAVAADKKPEVQKVKFPSCCACVLEDVSSIQNRFTPLTTPA